MISCKNKLSDPAQPGLSSMIDTLIAYQTDTPAPGLLRVRLRQWPMIAMLLLVCVSLMGIPLGFTVDALHGKDPLANLARQPGLVQVMAVLGLAMLSMAGPAGLWLWPVRESLLLSQTDQRGWRITSNVFGRRRRVSDEFSLEGVRGLHLRQGGVRGQTFLEPVLVDSQGEPHGLGFASALLKPGSARAADYLGALSAFFGKPWPAPVADTQAWDALMQQLKPKGRAKARDGKGKAKQAGQGSAGAPAAVASSAASANPAATSMPAAAAIPASATPVAAKAALASDPPPISLPLRVTLGVVGVFFGLVTVNNLFAVLSGLFSGRLATSGSRFSHTTHVARFADAPVWFSVNVLIETIGVLFLASITYGCLRVALRAPHERRNRQAERDSASAQR